MRIKSIVVLSCILLLSTVLLSAQPTTAQSQAYAHGLQPDAFTSPKLHWLITNVTNEVVEFGFGSGTYWKTRAGQEITFEIHKIENNELHGFLTIGNLTVPANDSRIASELVFSIWPWFPGLVSHLEWDTVDQAAINAASSFFMNGSLEILTTTTTRAYVYHQGPWGNQNTTLIYDLSTGILLAGYTEFFFLNDYHLGIEFVMPTRSSTNLTTLLFFATFVITLIIVALSVIIARRTPQWN